MPEQPLHPFAPPSSLLATLPVSPGTVVVWVLYVIFAFWALYTLVAIYHWFKYSHASSIAFPAIAVHLFISFALMSYALSGHVFILTPYLP